MEQLLKKSLLMERLPKKPLLTKPLRKRRKEKTF